MNSPLIYFDHEKLVACQRSIQFAVRANHLLEKVSSKLAVHNQLDRERQLGASKSKKLAPRIGLAIQRLASKRAAISAKMSVTHRQEITSKITSRSKKPRFIAAEHGRKAKATSGFRPVSGACPWKLRVKSGVYGSSTISSTFRNSTGWLSAWRAM